MGGAERRGFVAPKSMGGSASRPRIGLKKAVLFCSGVALQATLETILAKIPEKIQFAPPRRYAARRHASQKNCLYKF
jgi:hypothetical protein